jgi:Lipocalin-like domain
MEKTPLTDNLASKIIGIWMLKSREDVDAEGKILIDPFLGRDPIGILCFGPSHFSAQFMKRDRSEKENLSERVQATNNTAALNGYDAYFGTYMVDETAGTIATYLEGSISRINIGKTFIREARVVGNELIIQLKTTSVDGRAITRTNTFSRAG